MAGVATGVSFPMGAFEAAIAADPEVLGALYSGSQGRGTMDRYSDLDLHVWVTDEVFADGSRKLAELLATLGEVRNSCPVRPKEHVTALVGPEWQRVDLGLIRDDGRLQDEEVKPWPGFAGARVIKDT